MRLFANARYDFLGKRRLAYVLSALVIIPGLIIGLARGINYSVEFTGGTMIRVTTAEPGDVARIRASLSSGGVPSAEIARFGSNREFMIRAGAAEGTDANNTEATVQAVTGALDRAVGAGQYTIDRAESVGPKVGSELREKAILAILLSFVAVLIYLWYRFEWRFGAAAVAATAHDILATIAFIGVFRVEVSLFVVGALLSVVGYSLNDTIVIFDRVRENLRKAKNEDFIDLLNRSVNETLPRTILTSGTTLAVILSLAILGGTVVRPFAQVMFFGILIGTFSSIFVASPILLYIEGRWPGELVRGVRPSTQGARSGRGAKRPQPVA